MKINNSEFLLLFLRKYNIKIMTLCSAQRAFNGGRELTEIKGSLRDVKAGFHFGLNALVLPIKIHLQIVLAFVFTLI